MRKHFLILLFGALFLNLIVAGQAFPESIGGYNFEWAPIQWPNQYEEIRVRAPNSGYEIKDYISNTTKEFNSLSASSNPSHAAYYNYSFDSLTHTVKLTLTELNGFASTTVSHLTSSGVTGFGYVDFGLKAREQNYGSFLSIDTITSSGISTSIDSLGGYYTGKGYVANDYYDVLRLSKTDGSTMGDFSIAGMIWFTLPSTNISAEKASVDFATGAPAAVPLPGAVWLLGSGLVGLVGLRRKLFNA